MALRYPSTEEALVVERRDSRAGGREECRRGSRVRYAGHVLPRTFPMKLWEVSRERT